MQVGGFNAPKPAPKVVKRTFGQKLATSAKPKAKPAGRPLNRLERRRQVALAPRGIKQQIKEARDQQPPHPLAIDQYIPAGEELSDEDRATVYRGIKNALKRKRRDEARNR